MENEKNPEPQHAQDNEYFQNLVKRHGFDPADRIPDEVYLKMPKGDRTTEPYDDQRG